MAKRNLFAGKLIFLLLNFTAEFTLLSNTCYAEDILKAVLLYSEFTLLSNRRRCYSAGYNVLLYSEFTLLSNATAAAKQQGWSFTVF